jgi:hypothetical protein
MSDRLASFGGLPGLLLFTTPRPSELAPGMWSPLNDNIEFPLAMTCTSVVQVVVSRSSWL